MNSRQHNRALHPAILILLALALALVLVVSSATFADDEEDMQSEDQDFHVSQNGWFRYHKMTEQDIEVMKQIVGVRQEGVDYNTIMGGFGTGYAPPTEQEYDAMLGVLNIVDGLTKTAPPPGSDSLDLSADPRFPKVDSQGGQGSCAAWATTYYAYGYSQARYFGWTDASAGNPSHLVSPSWTYNKANIGFDIGSNEMENSQVIRDWGCATWEAMPYDDDDFISWGDEAAYRNAMNHYPGEIFQYSTSQEPDPEQKIAMIKSILEDGAVPTLFIWASFYSDGVYDDYILTAGEMDWDSYSGAHLNAIVGYDDRITVSGETGAFRVVNSWGDTFADGGFYWITYDAYLAYEHTHTWFENPAHEETTLMAVWEYSDPGGRNGNLAIYNGPQTNNIKQFYSDYVNPWAAGGSHDLPPFMCCRIDGLIDDWAMTDYFYLYQDYGDPPSTVSSYYLEYYDQDYVTGQPVEVSEYCSRTPKREPFTIGLQYPYRDYPVTPSDPDPEHETMNVSTDASLSWSCTDPEGDSLSYDFYLGTEADPALSETNLQSESISPVGMVPDTTYYWKVVASDVGGHTAEGPVWSFVTGLDEPDLPPDVPGNPFPADGELSASTDLTLTWESDDPNEFDTVTFDVYFGEAGQMELVANRISESLLAVEGLGADRFYEWKVVAFDDTGLFSEGSVWTFKTTAGAEQYVLTINAEYKQGRDYKSIYDVAVSIDGQFAGYSGSEFIVAEPGPHTVMIDQYFALKNTSYEFERWEEPTSSDNPITIEIIDDMTITAQYE